MANIFDKLNAEQESQQQATSNSDYTSLSGGELLRNRDFLDDLYKYYDAKGQSFGSTSEMLDEWYTDQRWKDSNFVSAGLDMAEYKMAGSDQGLMTRLSKAWGNAPTRGSVMSRVWDYGLATVADPINFIPYAGAAAKAGRVAKAAKAAGQTSKQAVGTAMKQGAIRGAALEGTIGGGLGAGMEAVQQSRQIQQGLSTDYDTNRIAMAGALEGAFSGAIGAPLGALFSRNPAQMAVSVEGTPLLTEMNTRMNDLAALEKEASAVISDPQRAIDHEDAKSEVASIIDERSAIQAVVQRVETLNAEVESLAQKMQSEGADVTTLKPQYDAKLKELTDLTSSTDIPANRQGPVRQAQAVQDEAVGTNDTAQTAENDGTQAGTQEGETSDGNANTEASAEANTEAETGAEVEAEVSAEEPEAPTVPDEIPVPEADPIEFRLDGEANQSLQKSIQTHRREDGGKTKDKKSKQRQAIDDAGRTPLSDEEIGRILADVDGAVDADGVVTTVGRTAIRVFLNNREGKLFNLGKRKNAKLIEYDAVARAGNAKRDEADFTNPNVAKAEAAVEAAPVAEMSEITEEANTVFRGMLEKSGGNKTRLDKLMTALAKSGEISEQGAAAVRRRIKDYNEKVRPIVEKLNRAEAAEKIRSESKAMDERMAQTDMTYTPPRVAGSTNKSAGALENDPTAGRVFITRTDPKTGEAITSSKIQSFFKPGQDLGDGYTVTEGGSIFRRVNETEETAKAQAEMDVARGVNKAVYAYPARAGQRVVGIKGGGRGRGGEATEGQQVYGMMLYTGKGDPVWKTFATQEMALERLGLKKSGDIGVDTSKITPVKTPEEYEAAVDAAYEKFADNPDVDVLNEDLAVAKASARAGDVSVDAPDAPTVRDGRGKVVDTDIPDYPLQKGDKVLVLLPKTKEVPVIMPGVRQMSDEGRSLKDILGSRDLSMYNVGYVPKQMGGKSAQSQKVNRNLIRDNFEPAEAKYAFDFTPETKEAMPPRPLDWEETASIQIDIQKMIEGGDDGEEVANLLFVGSNIVYGGTDQMLAPDAASFRTSRPSLEQLTDVMQGLERSAFKTEMVVGGKTVEIPIGLRMKALTAYYKLMAQEAPLGIKRPVTDIESSIASLNKSMGSVPQKVAKTIERLLREVVPTDNAPIFAKQEDVFGGEMQGSMFAYSTLDGEKYNKIGIDANSFDKDGTRTGINGSFTVMHELAHWAYENLMPNDLKSEFWEAVSKFYDEEAGGRFNAGGLIEGTDITLLDRFTPAVEIDGKMAGVSNGQVNPQEYFANQFSLYMHHKFEAPLATQNAKVWEKMAAVVQKLWRHITGRHIIDPDMEQIFDKLIASKDEARRVQFTFPKEPTTSFGRSIRTRYSFVNSALTEFENAMKGYPDAHDPEKMAMAARELSTQFNGMSMLRKDQVRLASRAKTDSAEALKYKNATGAFRIFTKAEHTKMRAISRKINEMTAATDQLVSQVGDDMEVRGSAMHSDTAEALSKLFNEDLKEFAESIKTKLNESYMDIEYGDIPEARISEAQLDLRARYNITGERIAKKESFEKVKRATNVARANLKRSLNQALKLQGKANKKAFSGEAVVGTKGDTVGNYNLTEALVEFRRQVDVDGNPTDFGRKLAGRVKHLVNTEKQDVTLSAEEEAIYHTWQSKAKGAGAKGKANAADISDLSMGLAVSIDGEAIKGLGASPEQAVNIIKHLIRQRKQNRLNKKKGAENPKVDQAIIAEQAQEIGVGFENGVPQNANFGLRNYLRGITHRNPAAEYNARTLTARLARLDSTLPENTEAPSYAGYRKAVRAVGVALEKSDDISKAVYFTAESMYGSNVVSHATRNVINEYAAQTAEEPSAVFARLTTEAMDTLSPKATMKQMKASMGGENAELLDDMLEELDTEVTDAMAYALNGLISSKGARERYYAISMYGDMFSTQVETKGTSRGRYGDQVPAEYAIDYAYEVLETQTQAGRNSIEEFTGGNVRPYFQTGVTNGPLGRGVYVQANPSNTASNMSEKIASSVPEDSREVAFDLVEQLIEVRGQVNRARLDPLSSSGYIERLYTLDDMLTEELSDLGAAIDTTVRPVVVRDTNPAFLRGQMTKVSPLVKALHGHYVQKVANDQGGRQEAKAIEAIRGVSTPEEMLEKLTSIAGSPRKLRDALKEAGYTSLNLGSDKMMLQQKDVRSIRSEIFEDASPVLGEVESDISLNAQIMRSMDTGADPIKVFTQAAPVLENNGVPPKTLDAMIALARGKGLPSEAAQEIRKSNIFNPLRSNARTMARSGLSYLANFFEPVDGSGGHFERTNARMGKFVVPLTKMLKDLPDSGSMVKQYWQTGPMMMAESAMGSLGMSPNRRMTQPASHTRIISALRNKSSVNGLDAKERRTYDHIRGYLDSATQRLRANGAVVGDIAENYFPQIWRKDLIEADQSAFTERLTKFLTVSTTTAGNTSLSKEAAREAATRIVRKLLDEDGILSNPSHTLKRAAGDGDADHLDYQRMLRLDQFPDFVNFDSADSLAPFLENDLLVTMTKYSDNLEHRLDINQEFGPGAHGYHDYLAIIGDPDHAQSNIGKLLSSNEVIRSTHSRYNGAAEGKMGMKLDNTVFFAPIKDKYKANEMGGILIEKARKGATQGELRTEIMSLLDNNMSNTPEADLLRRNFERRADAIAAALTDTKGMTKLTSQSNIRHAQGVLNATLRKPIDGMEPLYNLKKTSKVLRGVNAVTLLGFTTLTSLGDLVLPLIRTGDFASYTKALKNFAQNDGAYRDMIRNVGAATENAVHQRMTVAHGVDSTQFMTGFFNATLLTPWTDTMRDIAAAVSYEHIKSQHRILREKPGSRQGRIARRILMEEGLSELVEDKSLDLDLIMESRGSAKEHPLSDKIAASTIKITNQMIFTPNPNDNPLWAQTPMGAIAWQLKSYPMMMTRLLGTVFGEAFRGDNAADRAANFAKAFVGQSDNRLAPLAALLTAGPAMGAFATATKDVVQGRGGEDNREFALRERNMSKNLPEAMQKALEENEDLDSILGWYFDGMMALGGLGLLGETFYDITAQTDNGAYGIQRTTETLFGPTMGLYHDALTVTQGARSWIDGKEANGERRAAVREIVSRTPVLGGISWAREGVTDYVAGAKGAGSKSKGGSGGFGSGFGGGF